MTVSQGHGTKKGRRTELAIAALITENSIAAAARTAGIGETTLLRWLRDRDFQCAYRAARRQVVESAVAQLQQATGEAVAALRRNLSEGSPASQVAAARVILEQAIKATEVMDIAERLEALEEIAKESANANDRS